MNILLCFQVQQSSSIWETVFAIIVAFIGGGIVNYLIELRRDSKKAKMLRHLIASEIKMNLDVLESEYVQKTPWITHKTWSAFYDANSIEVTSFSDKETAENIMKFYAYLEYLTIRNDDDRELERLWKQSKPEVAENFRRVLGEGKQGIRTTLIGLGKDTLKAKL
jgi:hypothetical protein